MYNDFDSEFSDASEFQDLLIIDNNARPSEICLRKSVSNRNIKKKKKKTTDSSVQAQVEKKIDPGIIPFAHNPIMSLAQEIKLIRLELNEQKKSASSGRPHSAGTSSSKQRNNERPLTAKSDPEKNKTAEQLIQSIKIDNKKQSPKESRDSKSSDEKKRKVHKVLTPELKRSKEDTLELLRQSRELLIKKLSEKELQEEVIPLENVTKSRLLPIPEAASNVTRLTEVKSHHKVSSDTKKKLDIHELIKKPDYILKPIAETKKQTEKDSRSILQKIGLAKKQDSIKVTKEQIKQKPILTKEELLKGTSLQVYKLDVKKNEQKSKLPTATQTYDKNKQLKSSIKTKQSAEKLESRPQSSSNQTKKSSYLSTPVSKSSDRKSSVTKKSTKETMESSRQTVKTKSQKEKLIRVSDDEVESEEIVEKLTTYNASLTSTDILQNSSEDITKSLETMKQKPADRKEKILNAIKRRSSEGKSMETIMRKISSYGLSSLTDDAVNKKSSLDNKIKSEETRSLSSTFSLTDKPSSSKKMTKAHKSRSREKHGISVLQKILNTPATPDQNLKHSERQKAKPEKEKLSDDKKKRSKTVTRTEDIKEKFAIDLKKRSVSAEPKRITERRDKSEEKPSTAKEQSRERQEPDKSKHKDSSENRRKLIKVTDVKLIKKDLPESKHRVTHKLIVPLKQIDPKELQEKLKTIQQQQDKKKEKQKKDHQQKPTHSAKVIAAATEVQQAVKQMEESKSNKPSSATEDSSLVKGIMQRMQEVNKEETVNPETTNLQDTIDRLQTKDADVDKLLEKMEIIKEPVPETNQEYSATQQIILQNKIEPLLSTLAPDTSRPLIPTKLENNTVEIPSASVLQIQEKDFLREKISEMENLQSRLISQLYEKKMSNENVDDDLKRIQKRMSIYQKESKTLEKRIVYLMQYNFERIDDARDNLRFLTKQEADIVYSYKELSSKVPFIEKTQSENTKLIANIADQPGAVDTTAITELQSDLEPLSSRKQELESTLINLKREQIDLGDRLQHRKRMHMLEKAEMDSELKKLQVSVRFLQDLQKDLGKKREDFQKKIHNENHFHVLEVKKLETTVAELASKFKSMSEERKVLANINKSLKEKIKRSNK